MTGSQFDPVMQIPFDGAPGGRNSTVRAQQQMQEFQRRDPRIFALYGDGDQSLGADDYPVISSLTAPLTAGATHRFVLDFTSKSVNNPADDTFLGSQQALLGIIGLAVPEVYPVSRALVLGSLPPGAKLGQTPLSWKYVFDAKVKPGINVESLKPKLSAVINKRVSGVKQALYSLSSIIIVAGSTAAGYQASQFIAGGLGPLATGTWAFLKPLLPYLAVAALAGLAYLFRKPLIGLVTRKTSSVVRELTEGEPVRKNSRRRGVRRNPRKSVAVRQNPLPVVRRRKRKKTVVSSFATGVQKAVKKRRSRKSKTVDVSQLDASRQVA